MMTRHKSKLLYIWVVIATILIPATDAGAGDQEGRRVALVIGNNAYKERALRNAVNDARAVKAVLENLGFAVEKKENTSLLEMEEAIRKFASSIGSGDVALFFFSGHGLQIDGVNYLVPTDFDARSAVEAKHKSYSASLLCELMEASGSYLNIVILDACRNNPFKAFRGGERGLAPMNAGSGSFIAFATGPNNIASDNVVGENGLYTKHLLPALQAPGLELEDVFKQVGQGVKRESGGRQQPWTTTNFYDYFYFVKGNGTPQRTGVTTIGVAGTLSVTVNMAGADIIVDGRKLATSEGPQTLTFSNMAYGTHEVTVRKDLFRSDVTSESVEVPVGGSASVTARLKPIMSPADMFDKGENYFDDENYSEALRYYHPAAELGHADSQFSLGYMYDEGYGIEENNVEAAEWYRRAAEQGDAAAQHNLGTMYLNGEGVEKDLTEARTWLAKSANQGFAMAQYSLGNIYDEGLGVDEDDQEAAKWYLKAARQGYEAAQFMLGDLYESGSGVEKDEQEAVKWYTKAANQGNAPAQYYLGYMYENGHLVEENTKEAAKWYLKAAKQGFALAQYSLGLMYDHSIGVNKDYSEAVWWYRKAAEQGHEGAQTNLGFMYLYGLGVEEDYAEARQWFLKAASQESVEAQYNLGLMYENGWGVAEDMEEAIRWYRKAADQGDEDAEEALKRLGR